MPASRQHTSPPPANIGRQELTERFDLHQLKDVDRSRKRVRVHYRVLGSSERLAPYRKHETAILRNVSLLYDRYGVDLEFLTTGIFPFRPDVTSIQVIVADEDTYYQLRAKEMEDLSSRIVIRKSYGYADVGARTVTLKVFDSDADIERQERDWAIDTADAFAHELGHLFTLTHPGSWNDGISAMPTPHRHNLMKGDHPIITSCGGEICGRLVPAQVLQMHSYLSKGDTYRAFAATGNDFDRFVEQYAKE